MNISIEVHARIRTRSLIASLFAELEHTHGTAFAAYFCREFEREVNLAAWSLALGAANTDVRLVQLE